MKHTKKLASLLLSLVMVLALVVPSLAAGFDPSGTCTVTFDSPFVAVYANDPVTSNKFEGYQLLSLDAHLKTAECHAGTAEDPHNSDCYNYAYDFDTLGDNRTSKYKSILMTAAGLNESAFANDGAARDALLNKLKNMDAAATRTFADDVYEAIKAAKLPADVTTAYPSLNVEQGYWLFADISVYEDNTENTVKSLVLLDTAGNPSVTVAPKQNIPEVEKKISDAENGPFGDYTDVSVGDEVYFKITGTLPTYLGYYEVYKYVIHDTLSSGLTLDADSIKVTVDGTDVTAQLDTKPTSNQTGGTFSVGFDDVLSLTGVNVTANSEIVLTYSATLNESAVIGNPGNPNKVYLEYSNDPYDETGKTTGKTPEDTVVAFTFELDVTKVDGDNPSIKLDGAQFKLYNAAGKWLTVDSNNKVSVWVDSEDEASTLETANGKFVIIGLDQGTYYLKETASPAGYNLLKAPIQVVITATYDTDQNPNEVKTLTVTVDNDAPASGNVSTGVVGITVKNNTGVELPETGGMGTTIFYVLGGALVLGAVVLLITKKRMDSSDK